MSPSTFAKVRLYPNLVSKEQLTILPLATINEHNFQIVFKRFYNPLCNFAASIVKDDKLAQDVVQDVFTHLWDKRNAISISENEKSYLFSAVKNKSIEKLRQQMSESQLADAIRIMQEQPVEIEADKYLLREHINNSLRQLPPKCKQIFELSKMNGLTYAEIAEELDISVKTVENQIGKAYRILRDLLAGKVDEIYS